MTEAVRLERRDAVLEITLDRPKANAIDADTSRRLGAAFQEFRADPALRAAIVIGAGERFFSAGWDLKAAAEGETIDSDFGPGGFAGLTELLTLDKPVIAAVNGLAVGGGFELALGADLIVAAEHAEFFLPEVAVGVVADAASFRLPHRIPRAVALEMLFTGRRMAADEALRWGLINQVAPATELVARARDLASQIVAGAPLSLAAVKELVRYGEDHSIIQCDQANRKGELAAYQRMLESDDAREGPKAFAEKRPPRWQGH